MAVSQVILANIKFMSTQWVLQIIRKKIGIAVAKSHHNIYSEHCSDLTIYFEIKHNRMFKLNIRWF